MAAQGCSKMAPCRNALVEKGLGALLGIGVAKTALDSLSTSEQQYVFAVAMSGGRADLVEKLTPEQRAAYDYLIEQDKKGIFSLLPAQQISTGETLSKPNIAKDLTDEEKKELGGTGSSSSGGWGPDDDEDWNKLQSTGSSGNEIKHIYNSIKDAPQYPQGFRASQNGTTKNAVNDRALLEQLRKIEPGKWNKVYKDGFDTSGNKVSVHYFQSQSGRVFNVKVKPNWSNLK